MYVANYEEGDAAAITINIEDNVTSGELKKKIAKPKQYWHEKKNAWIFHQGKAKET